MSQRIRTGVILLTTGMVGIAPGGAIGAQGGPRGSPPHPDVPGPIAPAAAPVPPPFTPRVWTRAEWARGAPPGPVSPYDLLHHDLVLHDLTWGTGDAPGLGRARTNGSVQGTVTTTLIVRGQPTETIALDASGGVTVTAAVDADGHTLPFSPSGGWVTLRLPHTAAVGDTVRFRLTFTSTGPSFTLDQGRWPVQLWTEGTAWFPTRAGPDDMLTWDVTVTAPKDYQVLSSGTRISDTRVPGGAHTVHWRQDRPAPLIALALAVGPLAAVRSSWIAPDGRRVPVEAYVHAEDTAYARRMLRDVVHAIDLYTRLTGVPFPASQYKLAQITEYWMESGGSTDRAALAMMSGQLPDAREYPDRPAITAKIAVHETAHEWFGQYVNAASDAWLNEGFADYMTAQFWGATQGVRDEQEFLYFFNKRWDRGPGNLEYYRGALVLDMLRKYLGDQRFWTSVRTYLTRRAYQTARTQDFEEALEQTSGEDLSWFFDEWVYGAGPPEFAVTAQYDSAERRVTLQVQQTQQANPSRTPLPNGDTVVVETPAIFRMPVAIRVATTRGDVVYHTLLNERTQTIVIDGIPAPPITVIFDDQDGIFKILKFEQPTAWLAAQLAREPTVWQTWWALHQLRLRAERDTEALAALVRAVRMGRYRLTREQAIDELTAMAAGTPSPVLTALHEALRDSSVLVRRAALRALVLKLPEPEAGALLVQRFKSEPSDGLRAWMVGASTQLTEWNNAARRSFLQTALSTPSVRDTIQYAAVQAVALGQCDPALVPGIEALLGKHWRVAKAMYKMHDWCPAMNDAWQRHRDDARPYVRQWMRWAEAGQL